ncbi:50S ribosomal protein L13 [bacterium CG10_46_32]|nr:MAG: 50S ribosomal protein L13 [bacterium CG10_46_32]PIR55926.1 MAG: 50S ribosomal protein L13 [Parcubacteria group bacterium CG10_big_fil_rev_8_21_14_0_10_46_32]
MNREIHTIDAAGVSLGRVATQVAVLLMGKNKASYVPYKDEGDKVVITNYSKMKFTGANKMEQKRYYRPTKRVGGLKSETLRDLWDRRPEEVLKRAVLGMLPKNTLRKAMIKRLSINDSTE